MMVSPALLWSTVSLVVYILARQLYRRFTTPLLVPVMVTIVVVIVLLSATGTDYETYMEGGRLISFFLGPSVVALGIPLYRNLQKMRRAAGAISLAVAAGSIAGVVGAVLPAVALHLPDLVTRSLAPKSVTTPIAISLAESVGGEPGLTAAFVVVTGLFGAVLGPVILRIARVTHPVAWGLAMGTAAHGVGTSLAIEKSPEAGAAAGLGICLCGVATSAITPLLVRLLLGV